jgi:hypothetical protein
MVNAMPARYEYRVEARPPGREVAAWLNEQARDGWRLVHVGYRRQLDGTSQSIYYFEREAQEIETKDYSNLDEVNPEYGD